MISVTATGFGPAAIDDLARVLDARRGGDVLGPALVVCSEPLVAVGVRRALGWRPGGVAGVDVTTVDRLVDDLATAPLAAAGQHPASDLELQVAIRAELAQRPGRFAPVAGHHTTEERLVKLHHELAGLGNEAFDRLAGVAQGLALDAVRVLRAVIDRPGPAVPSDRLLELALAALDDAQSGSFGPIVVYLPEPERPFEGRVVAALARRPDCDVLVGLTGDRSIDNRLSARLAGWGIQVEPPRPGAEPAVPVKRATVLEVADPGDEVAAAIGDVVAHAALGVPLAQMAILYSAADPYASLLDEQLSAAGLPWCGPGQRPLSSSLAGRFVLRLLELARRGLERSAFVTFVSAAPVALADVDGGPDSTSDARGTVVPAAWWDALSRRAGVISADQWGPRLSDLARRLRSIEAQEADAAELDRLQAFVAELGERLARPGGDGDGGGLATWEAWSSWLRDLISRYLIPGDDWPDAELVAFQRVLSVVDRLAGLDSTGERPRRTGEAFEAFESIVSAQLDRWMVPGRPYGEGLLVAPIGAVAGLPFERVVVVGLAEGAHPRTAREDSLLPDRVRAACRGLLLPTEAVTDLDIRAVAAALAGARQAPLVVTARGDLRSTRSRSWPRVLNGLVGQRNMLESHHRLVADHGRPASLADFGLRALITHVDGGDPVHTHELALSDGVLAASLARGLNRRRAELNLHVGRVPAGTIDASERLMSPTALEDYAACPRSYLLGRVLRLGEDERPERIDEILPADRGTLVHAVLERFLAEAIESGSVPGPGEPWSADRCERLLVILADEVTAAQTKGLTGGRVSTQILHRRLRAEMETFLENDNRFRADHRSTPWAVELGFGFDDEPSVVHLPDGRSLKLRGRVDRVDVTDDGGVMVIDYKGGSGRAYTKLDDNPLDGGRRLQLPLYARVVAERLGRDGPRTAYYWLTSKGDQRPLVLSDAVEQEVERLVTAALDGIAGGLFPGVPGEAVGWPRMSFENCRYCDFDRICPSDRQREWESVRHDPSLKAVEVLLDQKDDQ